MPLISKDSQGYFLLMVLVTPIYSEDFHLTDFFDWSEVDGFLRLGFILTAYIRFRTLHFWYLTKFPKILVPGFLLGLPFLSFFGRCLPPWTTLDNIHHSYGWPWIPPWKLTCPLKIDGWNMKLPKLHFLRDISIFPKHHVVPPWKNRKPWIQKTFLR